MPAGKCAFLAEVVESIEDVLAGRSLIGRATREALLDELREPRSRRHDILSTFERLIPREHRLLGALIQGASSAEIAEAHVVALCTIRAQVRPSCTSSGCARSWLRWLRRRWEAAAGGAGATVGAR